MLQAIRFEILRGIQCGANVTFPIPERPKRVALLLDQAEFNVTKALIHHKTVFFDEPMHDYDWQKGSFRYHSHAAAHGDVVDVLLVYEEGPYLPQVKFDQMTGKPVDQSGQAQTVLITKHPDANGMTDACVRFTHGGAVPFHIDVKYAKSAKPLVSVADASFGTCTGVSLEDAESAAAALLESIRMARQALHERNGRVSQHDLGVLSQQLQEQLEKIDQMTQRQDSSLEQLAVLYPFANRLGLYDAADLIRTMITKKEPASWRR